MKTLKPQLFLPSYYAGVEREIRKFFEDLIFRPLFDVFEDEGMEIENSGDLIAEAIRLGKISFEGGVFRGEFNARISVELSKIGAKYSKKAGGFVLKSAPHASVSMAVASAAATQERIMTKALSVLQGISVKE